MLPYIRPHSIAEPPVPATPQRRLRREMSPPEVILWNELRNRRLAGLKFRRQHPLGPYFADFYCHEARLVVEIDGASHRDRVAHDRHRDAWMRSQGLQILRIPASHVSKDKHAVLSTILDTARANIPPLPRSDSSSAVGEAG